jgi:glycosyltransferase involved in cell wall biosynthesis
MGSGTGLVEHRGLQNRSEVAALLAGARIGLAVVHPLECFIQSQPTKLYEYMSAGLPVVVSDFPIWREIVASANCGLLVNPLDPEAIAEAIVWLLSHPAEAEQMGRNGRRAVVENYNWEQESARLTSIYSELLADQATGAQALRKQAAGSAEGR